MDHHWLKFVTHLDLFLIDSSLKNACWYRVVCKERLGLLHLKGRKRGGQGRNMTTPTHFFVGILSIFYGRQIPTEVLCLVREKKNNEET